MIKKTICCLLMFMTIVASAQTQRGYVKSLGRPDKPGEPLEGVIVRVRGFHNAIISDNDGTFAIDMTGKQAGEGYSLQQVRKNGYELNDNDVIGRQYAFSEQVPLTLVMVLTEQLHADKQRIEDNAYQAAERNYKQQMLQLERQLSDSLISAESYRERIADLHESFESYQSLIDGLAEHYAHIDYDFLDEKEREISKCIENGELERADSLLKIMFDPTDVLQRNIEALAEIERQIAEAQNVISEANADMTAVLRQQEKDAEHLYQLYTIALARFDNDKARFYLETRAELDTTNVGWQIDAGLFLYEYMADYEASLKYNCRALRQITLQSDEDNENLLNVYNQIGLVYDDMGEFDSATVYLQKMLDTSIKLYGEESYYTANAYSHIGSLYGDMNEPNIAMEYHLKALAIREKLPGNPMIAESYNNLARLYSRNGDYEKAIDYYRRVIAIDRAEKGVENIYTATFYDNLGVVYGRMNENDSAMYYFQKACALREKLLSDTHPYLAISYYNIGTIYNRMKDYETALVYFYKTIAIEEKTLGPEHPSLASSYNNLGNVYRNMKDYPKALEYYTKSLNIYLMNFGENNPKTAGAYTQVGSVYTILGENDKALGCYDRALAIYEKAYGKDSPRLARIYTLIGDMYKAMNNNGKAKKYYKKASKLSS